MSDVAVRTRRPATEVIDGLMICDVAGVAVTAAGCAGGTGILVDAGSETRAAHMACAEIELDAEIRIRQLLDSTLNRRRLQSPGRRGKPSSITSNPGAHLSCARGGGPSGPPRRGLKTPPYIYSSELRNRPPAQRPWTSTRQRLRSDQTIRGTNGESKEVPSGALIVVMLATMPPGIP